MPHPLRISVEKNVTPRPAAWFALGYLYKKFLQKKKTKKLKNQKTTKKLKKKHTDTQKKN